MSFLDELDDLAERVEQDARDTFRDAVRLLETRAREDPRRLFKLLRTVRPVVVSMDSRSSPSTTTSARC